MPTWPTLRIATLGLLAGFISTLVRGEDWPQWRGPQRNGISQETGLLAEWPAEGPKLLWQVKEIGSGYSTPAVVGDRLYLLGNDGLENEFVQALSTADGKRTWATPLGVVGNPDQKPAYPGTRSTPTVDGKRLYALGSDGDLACLETAGGDIRWQKNLRSDFGGKPGEWAYSESPLVDGDVLVCTPGGSEATIVALDKSTGELIWKCPVPGGDEAAYASPIVVEAGGVRQYVQFLAKGVVGVNAKTGEFLWRYDRTAETSPANIASPLAHEGRVYTATGRGGGALVAIEGDGDALEVQEVYFSKELPSSIGGVVLLDGYLYGTNRQGLNCVEFATGNIQWQARGIGAGALCYAGGRLYLHGESGEVALVEATPEAYREKGSFAPPDQPERGDTLAWTYPVVANGRLYIRDLDRLWCYDISAEGQ